MYTLTGKCASKGRASGKMMFVKNIGYSVEKTDSYGVELDLERFRIAKADAINQLQYVYERDIHIVGEENAKIFIIQKMMIHETGFVNS